MGVKNQEEEVPAGPISGESHKFGPEVASQHPSAPIRDGISCASGPIWALEPCLALGREAPPEVLRALAHLLQPRILPGSSVTWHRLSCQTIPRMWVFLAVLRKQFAFLMTTGVPQKMLLVLQVKCQIVMQHNNSNLCSHKNTFSKKSFN